TPGRFSVGVAHLDHDRDQEFERLILAALQKFSGIEVLSFDRLITIRGNRPDESSRAGHEQARNLLRRSGAQAILWGEVLTIGSTSVSLLHWTTARESAEVKASERYKPRREDLDLPNLFWDDLTQVLALVISASAAEYDSQRGRFVADKLKPFV